MFKDKTVLITGGTGSFGRNFTKYLLTQSVGKVIVFSRDEYKQYLMEKELNDDRLRFFIGDIRDLPRLQRAFRGVDIVVHAAALKQVPALEYNPFEAVKTNILGSQNVIEASIDQEVSKTLLISSDKAVQPINLYGSTKLSAEKLFTGGNSYAAGKSIFSTVRYGNVVGSRGSIVEFLLNRKPGEEVNITDKEMTRFWLTLEQSFTLVTFALEHMEGGEIFVPKIPSMKIVDLFSALASDVTPKVIGIRPGEKIHETLLTEHESRKTYDLGDYYVVLPEFHYFSDDANKKYQREKKVSPDFSYSSDNNDQWLDANGIRQMTEKLRPTK